MCRKSTPKTYHGRRNRGGSMTSCLHHGGVFPQIPSANSGAQTPGVAADVSAAAATDAEKPAGSNSVVDVNHQLCQQQHHRQRWLERQPRGKLGSKRAQSRTPSADLGNQGASSSPSTASGKGDSSQGSSSPPVARGNGNSHQCVGGEGGSLSPSAARGDQRRRQGRITTTALTAAGEDRRRLRPPLANRGGGELTESKAGPRVASWGMSLAEFTGLCWSCRSCRSCRAQQGAPGRGSICRSLLEQGLRLQMVETVARENRLRPAGSHRLRLVGRPRRRGQPPARKDSFACQLAGARRGTSTLPVYPLAGACWSC